ncbi:MAG: T9SS type A sorting domain-containing protein [Agriterribacter sp.]
MPQFNTPLSFAPPQKCGQTTQNNKTLITFFIYGFLFITATLFVATNGYAQNTDVQARQQAQEFYNKIKSPEKTFEEFYKISKDYFKSKSLASKRVGVGSDDACAKVRPYCGNGDFESGLDPNQWSGAYGYWYGGLNVDPASLTSGLLSGTNPDNVYDYNARQTIVDSNSLDPIVGIRRVPVNGKAKALRLGNAYWGAGAEMLAKTLVVDASETILNFWYAVVFEDPNHSYEEQPAFSVRVYDCSTGLELPNVCNLGNGSNIVVSDASNPFFKSAYAGSVAYRDWSRAQVNLSAYIGKTVTILFTNKDCQPTGHYGYTYLDNMFTTSCPIPDPGDPIQSGNIKLAAGNDTCGIGKICVKYVLPFVENAGVKTTGTANVTLNIYQNSTLVKTVNSGAVSTYNADSSYCFSINPATLGINTALDGFDYAISGSFSLSGFVLSPITIGNPPAGQKAGTNNDYLIICPVAPDPNVYYSKPTGDLHNVLSWGINPDGSGTTPGDFGTGKTFNLANRSGSYTMTGNWTVQGTLVNPSGSQLKINGYTLSLTTLTGAGTLSGSTTSSLVIAGTGGGNFGTVNFTSGAGMLKAFTLNRSGTGGAATIGTALGVYDVLTITSGALTTGGRLTLKSTASGTARVAPVSGTISGNVTVERYIPARRAWRLINAPVGGTQTVNQAWQEGVTTASSNPNPAPGYGTYVTVGTVANGFDQNILGQSTSSLKSFTSAGALQAVTSTHAALVANKPYMLFVRGDRSITMRGSDVPANNTTLRATGPLLTGNQTIPVAAAGFTAVANPFASPINFAGISRTNVTNSFYVWDPKMGGANGVGAYVNISYNGSGYDITPASVSPESQYIQSGQAFLVQSTGMAGSLVIKESDKSATAAQHVFREGSGVSGQSSADGGLVFAPAKNATGLRVNLQAADGSQRGVLDEVFASYSSSFSDDIDNMDALKAENVMENLAIIRKGQSLMVDRRNLIQSADTLQLNLSNTSVSTYMFEFSPIELSGAQSVTLVDHYLQTNTDISLTETSQVFFQVGSDSRSSSADRFSVIIVNKKGLIPGIGEKAGIRAYPNPVTASGAVNLQFDNIKAGMYRVELLNSTGQIVYSRMMQLSNGTFNQQVNLGRNLPAGVYQMKITGKDSRTVIKIMRR